MGRNEWLVLLSVVSTDSVYTRSRNRHLNYSILFASVVVSVKICLNDIVSEHLSLHGAQVQVAPCVMNAFYARTYFLCRV